MSENLVKIWVTQLQGCSFVLSKRPHSTIPAISFFFFLLNLCSLYLFITRGGTSEYTRWQALPLIVAGSAGCCCFLFYFHCISLWMPGCKSWREKWIAELRQAIIEFAWSILHSSPRGLTNTVVCHYILVLRETYFPLHTTRTNAVKTGRLILLLLIKQLYLFSVVMSEAPFAGLNSIPRRRDKINLYGRPWVNVCGRGREVPAHAICALCFPPRFSMNTAHSNAHKGVWLFILNSVGKPITL